MFSCTRCLPVLACGACVVVSGRADAMTVQQLHTEYANGEYRLEMSAAIAAPPDRVAAVIRDYAHYRELDPRILEARVLERSADRVSLFTRIDVCFRVLCRKVERVENVREFSGGLLAISVADRSDVAHGETRTEWIAEGKGTRLHYSTSITPKFWVPALFGRRWMLENLRTSTVALFTKVEARASAPPSAYAAGTRLGGGSPPSANLPAPATKE